MNIGSTSYLPEPLPLLSGSALKIIAVVSMVIDHYAYYLMDGNTMTYEVMRCFGRIAFPVFAFLVAEGFAHTRNRMRYFLSLMLFAVVSEVPWYLLNGADGTHNVMFTLALGVGTSYLMLLFHIDDGMASGMVGSGLRMEGCADDSSVLPVEYGQEHTGHFAQDNAAAVCFSADDALRHNNGTRGFIHGNVAKYCFYAFYPAHLFLLCIC